MVSRYSYYQGRSFPYRRVGQLPQLPREPLSPWQLRPRLQLSSCAALPWQRRRAPVRAAGWPRRQQPESKWRARMCWLGLALGPNMSVAVGWAGPARCRRCGRAVRPCPGPAANSSGRPVLSVEIKAPLLELVVHRKMHADVVFSCPSPTLRLRVLRLSSFVAALP